MRAGADEPAVVLRGEAQLGPVGLQPVGPEPNPFGRPCRGPLRDAPLLLHFKEPNLLAQGPHLALQCRDVAAVLDGEPLGGLGLGVNLSSGQSADLFVQDAGELGHEMSLPPEPVPWLR